MKKLCGRIGCSIALILLAFPSFSASVCSDKFSLADDGSISEWIICRRGEALRAVVPGENQFRLKISTQGSPPSAIGDWRRRHVSEEADQTFVATDATGTIEIRRAYRADEHNITVQTISVANLSSNPVTNFHLSLEIGGRSNEQGPGSRSLADYVYGYHRIEVAAGAGDWQPPVDGMQIRDLAITSRHLSLILQASNLVDVESKPEVAADSASARQPGHWRIVIDKIPLEPGEVRTHVLKISAVPTSTRTMAPDGYHELIYADVWGPLGALCRWVEVSLAWLQNLVGNLGLAMILFAIVARLITLPASVWSMHRQQEYKERFEQAKPRMDEAREKYKGAEQSERILAIYKEHQITPFSGLKGSIGLLVQIPFLLAVFNVTTRSSIFVAEEFLWISSLALPDAALALPFVVPILGGYVNALPLTLGVLNIASSMSDPDTSRGARIVPVFISLLIVTAFYSFSAALVLYWLTINLLQAGEKKLVKRFDTRSES